MRYILTLYNIVRYYIITKKFKYYLTTIKLQEGEDLFWTYANTLRLDLFGNYVWKHLHCQCEDVQIFQLHYLLVRAMDLASDSVIEFHTTDSRLSS